MKKFFLLLMIFGLLSILTFADETTPLVVWTDGGDVWVWQDGETTHIPIGDAIFPYLSPTGEQIALVRGDFYPEKLSVVSLTGDNLRDIDLSAYPRQVLWQSETVLWMNDFASLEGALGLPYGAMLYRINLETGDTATWDMGEPFIMTTNPSRDWLALSFAGVYQVNEGHISLLSLLEDNPQPQEMLRFPAISSGSHSGYFPSLRWITDEIVRTTIAEPDAFYLWDERAPETQLWEFDVTGTSTLLGEIQALLYPVPQWSGDGEWFTYIDPSRNEYTLVVAHDTGNNLVIRDVEVLPTLFSIPQNGDFLYLDRQVLLKRYGIGVGRASVWITSGSGIIGDVLLYPSGGVVVRLDGDKIRLGYAYWDDSQIYDLVDLSQYPAIDAKWD